MGQAKQRGSFEQRKSEAVEIRKILDAELAEKRAKLQIEIREREAKMSEEERTRRRKAQRLLASVVGISCGIGLAKPWEFK